MTIISSLLNTINKALSSEGVFLLCLALTFIGFLINLILAKLSVNYKRKDRRWYYFILPSVLSFQIAQTLNAGEDGSLIFLSLSVYCLLFFFSFSIKGKAERQKSQEDKLGEFCKKIQEQAKESKTQPIASQLEKCFGEPQKSRLDRTGEGLVQKLPVEKGGLDKEEKEDGEKENKEFALDFSHVKKVMSRLDYFSLSPADKRQIKELEITLGEAESGDYSMPIKERLNDGLGMLLKIMAKYGV